MTISAVANLVERLDRVTVLLLADLRVTKEVNRLAMDELLHVADGLGAALCAQETVPKDLVGKLWLVFTAMLTEAEGTKSPDAILDAAWNYQDRLRRIFGPRF